MFILLKIDITKLSHLQWCQNVYDIQWTIINELYNIYV